MIYMCTQYMSIIELTMHKFRFECETRSIHITNYIRSHSHSGGFDVVPCIIYHFYFRVQIFFLCSAVDNGALSTMREEIARLKNSGCGD